MHERSNRLVMPCGPYTKMSTSKYDCDDYTTTFMIPNLRYELLGDKSGNIGLFQGTLKSAPSLKCSNMYVGRGRNSL